MRRTAGALDARTASHTVHPTQSPGRARGRTVPRTPVHPPPSCSSFSPSRARSDIPHPVRGHAKHPPARHRAPRRTASPTPNPAALPSPHPPARTVYPSRAGTPAESYIHLFAAARPSARRPISLAPPLPFPLPIAPHPALPSLPCPCFLPSSNPHTDTHSPRPDSEYPRTGVAPPPLRPSPAARVTPSARPASP